MGLRGPKRKPIADRFWPKVAKSEGCWLWTAGRTSTGYGQLNTGGISGLPVGAHRVSWEIHYGPIPKGIEVRHRCDTPLCVRPDHLELGTHADNMGDMGIRGRSNNRKLTMDQVREMRRLYATGIGGHRLGKQFGIHKKNVYLIVKGKHYPDV